MAALALYMKSHTCRFVQRRNPALCIRIRIDFGRLELFADPQWIPRIQDKENKNEQSNPWICIDLKMLDPDPY
jgi:hypothetical protein